MRIRRKPRGPIAVWPLILMAGTPVTLAETDAKVATGAVSAPSGPAGSAADGAIRLAADDSWLCKYFPKYCGNEGSPGGLPGHSTEGESEVERNSHETRGPVPSPTDDSSGSAPAAPSTTAPDGQDPKDAEKE